MRCEGGMEWQEGDGYVCTYIGVGAYSWQSTSCTTEHTPTTQPEQVRTYISQKTYSGTLPRTGVVGNLCTVQGVQSGQNS